MLKISASQEVTGSEVPETAGTESSAGVKPRAEETANVGGAAENTPLNAPHIESNSNLNANELPEVINNAPKSQKSGRITNRKQLERHDAGRYDNMSNDASSSSSMENVTTARRSRKMQIAEAYDYDGSLSDCSQCRRKHGMGKRRRSRHSRRRASRSRSRRRGRR